MYPALVITRSAGREKEKNLGNGFWIAQGSRIFITMPRGQSKVFSSESSLFEKGGRVERSLLLKRKILFSWNGDLGKKPLYPF